MKKPSLSRAKERAWKAMSQYIRQKDTVDGYGRCVTCDETAHWKDMDAGHFIPKSRGLRAYFEIGEGSWSILPYCNVWRQCKGCNGPKGGEPVLFAKFIRDTYGEGVDVEMHQKLRADKFTTNDYLEIERYCKQKLEEL